MTPDESRKRFEEFLSALESGGLLSGAWSGLSFDELPSEQQDAIRALQQPDALDAAQVESDAAALVEKLGRCRTNGAMLALVLKYRAAIKRGG